MNRSEFARSMRIVWLALTPLALLALAAGVWFTPGEIAAGAPWQLLGLTAPACPGCVACGLSRSFAAMPRGEWALAAQLNSAAFVVWPAALVLGLGGLLLALRLATRWMRSPRAALPTLLETR